MAVGGGKDQRDHSKLNQELVQKHGKDAERLTGRKQGEEYDEQDDAGESEIEGQDLNIEGKQRRSDPLAAKGHGALILAVTAGDEQRMAMLFENGLDFGLAQRAAELVFLVFHLRANVFR